MTHEKQTPPATDDFNKPWGNPDDRRPEGGGLTIEPRDPGDGETFFIPTREKLGGSAVSLGAIEPRSDGEVFERTVDDSKADLDSRTRSSEQIEREGLVRIPGPDGEVQYRILEPTDGVAPNGGQTLFDWIVSRRPSAVFAKEDGGYRGHIDPSGADYKQARGDA